MKEKKTNCGIYEIKNIKNEKCYIGSSRNLWNRKNQHFNALQNNKCPNIHFQRSYNKHGKDSFRWTIIKYVEKIEDIEKLVEELIYWENYYIEDYKNNNIKLYNIRKIAENNLGTGKKIINLDTKEIFNSLSDASKKYGISKTLIGNVCRGEKITAKKFKWAYYEDYLNNNLKERKDLNKRSVINLDTKEIFNSIKECSDKYDISRSSIQGACQGKQLLVGGYRWAYYEENINIEDKIRDIDNKKRIREEENKHSRLGKKHPKLNKKVINLTTNKIFNSIREAEDFYNIKHSCHISRACKGKQKTAYGYEWAYYL